MGVTTNVQGSTAGPAVRLGRRDRITLYSAFGVLVAIVVIGTLHALFGIGGSLIDEFVRTWGASAVYVIAAAIVALRAIRVSRQRAAWTALAIGLSSYAVGNV